MVFFSLLPYTTIFDAIALLAQAGRTAIRPAQKSRSRLEIRTTT